MPASVPGSRPPSSGYEFTDEHFAAIRELVTSTIGVQLPEMKRQLAYSRFAKRMRQLGVGSFDQYIRLLRDPSSGEMDVLPSIITTNVTSFLREKHHFDYLAEHVLPRLSAARRVRIWSSACSTGEEPYSIAAVVLDTLGAAVRRPGFDLKILATDIDGDALARAAEGVYGADRLPDDLRARHAQTLPDGRVRIGRELRELITFRRLNLLGDWPMKGPFDVIFCRNVVIYFDNETKSRVFTRQAALQQPGGVLMIGHSEQLSGPTDQYQRVGHTIYEKR
jgi:chemotaxis protein methyltransferase CheR